jgi:hypothetical protein
MTDTTTDLDIYNQAARMTSQQLAAALCDLLGVTLVAYLGHVRETRAVRQWAHGTRTPNNSADVERLRIAYRAARLISDTDNHTIAQTWFQGLNPLLHDKTPAALLRDGDITDTGPEVLAAARHFTRRNDG